jgi:hypothetical protein
MIVTLFGTAVATLGLGWAAVATASRPSLFNPETVNPFDDAGTADPSADTLCGEAMTRTQFAQSAGWKFVTLTNLREVEDLLDSLEAARVNEREVHTLDSSSFAVRWR